MALNKLLLYLSAITIATLFNGSAHGAAAELQSALANWDISFVAFTANFNQNNDREDLVSEFEIDKNQVVAIASLPLLAAPLLAMEIPRVPTRMTIMMYSVLHIPLPRVR